MIETKIIVPIFFLRVEKEGNDWDFMYGNRVFYNGTGKKISLVDRELKYGLTKEKIKIELFRLQSGRDGHYLVNLKEQQYYYCGTEWENVKSTLISLGIGRSDDPQ